MEKKLPLDRSVNDYMKLLVGKSYVDKHKDAL